MHIVLVSHGRSLGIVVGWKLALAFCRRDRRFARVHGASFRELATLPRLERPARGLVAAW